MRLDGFHIFAGDPSPPPSGPPLSSPSPLKKKLAKSYLIPWSQKIRQIAQHDKMHQIYFKEFIWLLSLRESAKKPLH